MYRPPVDPVTVASPLAGEWWVGHGGHAELVNYHQTRSTQRDALDIMQVVDGSIHRPRRTDLTSYYIYDQPVLAPADGTLTYVVDGHPDLPIGSVDSQHPTGNQLVIDIGGDRYLLMGHLRQHSITVNVGERVTEGQPIARVGKSGHSSHPHIHIQAQTLPNGIADVTTIDGPQMLKTMHTYPLLFHDATLIRGGVPLFPDCGPNWFLPGKDVGGRKEAQELHAGVSGRGGAVGDRHRPADRRGGPRDRGRRPPWAAGSPRSGPGTMIRRRRWMSMSGPS